MARSPKTVKKQPRKARGPVDAPQGGSVMIRLLVSLVVLGAMAVAATTVKVGDRTIYEHGHALVNWEAVAEGATEAGRAATRLVQRELETAAERAEEKPSSSGPSKVVALGDNPPAEHLDAADRAALDSLLPH